MSETESFIEEVTEEVRRDKLFALYRRYGWIAFLLVVLIVGGAAYREWRIHTEAQAAQAFGDAIMTALDGKDAATQASNIPPTTKDGYEEGGAQRVCRRSGAQGSAGERGGVRTAGVA